jgi:AcrR family transcriptional regulator
MKTLRQQRQRENTIEEILATARAIMREEGIAALSMQELARRMGMKAPSLYNYFASKRDIYDALFRLGFEQFDTRMAEQLRDAPSWREALDNSIRAYMSFAVDNPELYQLCFERPVPGFTPSAESLAVSFRALRRGYAFTARWRANIWSDLSDEQITDLIIAVAHGLTAQHLANQPELPLGEGRFGGLISAAVSILYAAWSAPDRTRGDLP